MDTYLINFCPTGAVNGKDQSPHLPITVDEIIEDCRQALVLGAHLLHLHARDQEGQQSSDPGIYRELIEGVRALPGGSEAVVCVTTTGRAQSDPKTRAAVLGLTGHAQPDMASLTLSSLNFMQQASVNAPQTIEYLAASMKEAGIKPELEVFDLGMLNMVHVLIKKGLIEPPFYINLLLGNIATAQTHLHHVAALMADLPNEAVVCVGGLGRFQQHAHLLGLMYADGVRVGLEDNLHWQGKPVSNAQLIETVIAQAKLLGKVPESPNRARLRVLGAG